MNKYLNLVFLPLLISLLSCGTAKLTTVIDKGKIDDDVTIHLTEKNITLKPDQLFSLENLNLKAGNKALSSDNILDQYRHLSMKDYPHYNITIDKPGNKTYHGIIAFFNAPAGATDAVTRYYQLHIPESYFEKSSGGRIACVYEYSTKKTGRKLGSKITRGVLAPVTLGLSEVGSRGKGTNPTWIIWLSDMPL